MKLPTDITLTSHRSIFGFLIVWYKKLVKLAISPYLKSVFSEEHRILDEERFRSVEERFNNIEKRLRGYDDHFAHFDLRTGNVEKNLVNGIADLNRYIDDRIITTTTDIVNRTDSLFKNLDQKTETIEKNVNEKIDNQNKEQKAFIEKRRKELMLGHIFLRKKIEALLSNFAHSSASKTISVEEINKTKEDLMEFDYHIFENKWRDTNAITDIQTKYISYFKGKKNILDLGCGRGEFLTLLKKEGIDAYGVDLNQSMSIFCKQKKLKVVNAEAIEHLSSLEDSSLEGIFSAHLIEHIDRKELPLFMNLCYSKLKANSFIALETPNIASLITLADSFYKDLSHVTPLHHETLVFLLESSGFKSVEKKFFTPYSDETILEKIDIKDDSTAKERQYLEKMNQNIDHLNNILYGCLDYAVIAKK